MSVVLITGASSGIGLATARRLRADGHDVWLGARDAERGRAAAEGIGARSVQLDVTADDSVAAAVATIERRGAGLDALVNNAGIGVAEDQGVTGPRALLEFDTNAVGVVRVTEAALPLLRNADHPVVVNVSSGLGSFTAVTDPASPQSHGVYLVYAATKAAVGMLTVQYAKAHPAIRFTAVEPGFTATALTAHAAGAQTPDQAAEVVARWVTAGDGTPSGTFQGPDGVWPW